MLVTDQEQADFSEPLELLQHMCVTGPVVVFQHHSMLAAMCEMEDSVCVQSEL